MFCTNCGKKSEGKQKFCTMCDTPFSDDIASKENTFGKAKSLAPNTTTWIKKINYSKLILNKYVAILVGVILVVWMLSGDNSGGGIKAPLPAPVQQTSDDTIEIRPITPAVSLTNGTILKKSSVYLRGDGKLVIKNGTSLDAVAKLIRGGTSVLTVYIKANSNYTMPKISEGIYWLVFAQGLDWDSTTQKFRRNTQYTAFDETFDFNTTEDDQYYYSPAYEVTLNPVIGGDADTSSVDPAQFNAY